MPAQYYPCYDPQNLLETFLLELKKELAARKNELFYKPQVIVANSNLQNWLKSEIAKDLGIAAGIDFYFLEPYFNRLLDKDVSLSQSIDWTIEIFKVIKAWNKDQVPESLANTLHLDQALAGDTGNRSMRISLQLADLFSSYEREWGEFPVKDHWQFELYKEVQSKLKAQQKISLQDLPANIKKALNKKTKMPEKLHIVGASGLSEAFLANVHCLQEYYEITLYQLFPLDPKNHHPWYAPLRKRKARITDVLKPSIKQFSEQSPSNANLGRFLAALNKKEVSTDQEIDNSVQLIVAHSTNREVEAVVQHIKRALSANENLSPADIAILVPSLDAYAPILKRYLEPHNRVYSENGSQIDKRLPFNFTDLLAGEQLPVIDLIIALIRIGKSASLTRREIAGLFKHKELLHAIDASVDETRLFLAWLDKAGLARNALGNANLYSFKLAMSRLRLGILTETEYTELEHKEAGPFTPLKCGQEHELETLEKLCLFERQLASWQSKCGEANSGTDWSENIQWLLGNLIKFDNKNYQHRKVNEILQQFTDSIDQPDLSISAVELCTVLENQLNGIAQRGATYLQGGITISSHQPVRPVPFKVIYVLGINTHNFCAPTVKNPLDLMEDLRKASEKSTYTSQENQRLMLLESFQCARERLVLSAISPDDKEHVKLLKSLYAEADQRLSNILSLNSNVSMNDKRQSSFIELLGSLGQTVNELLKTLKDCNVLLPVTILPLSAYSQVYQKKLDAPGDFIRFQDKPGALLPEKAKDLLTALGNVEQAKDITWTYPTKEEGGSVPFTGLFQFILDPMEHFNQVFSNIRYQVRADPDIELESIETNFSTIKKDLKAILADSGISLKDALELVKNHSRFNGSLAREPWFEEDLEWEKWQINETKNDYQAPPAGSKKYRCVWEQEKVQIIHVADFKDKAGWTTLEKPKLTREINLDFDNKLKHVKHDWYVWQGPDESSFNVTSWENWIHSKHKVLADFFASVLCELEGDFNLINIDYKDGKFILEKQRNASLTRDKKDLIQNILSQALELYKSSPLALSFENLKTKSTEDPRIDNLSDFFSEFSSGYTGESYGQQQRERQNLILGDRNYLALEEKLHEEQKSLVVKLLELRREVLAPFS